MASSISLVGVLVLVVFSAAVPGFFFELLSELIGGVDLADAGKANSADAVATEIMLVFGFVRSGGDTSSCFSCCKLLPILLVLLGILRVVKSHVGTSTKSAKSPDSMQRMSQILIHSPSCQKGNEEASHTYIRIQHSCPRCLWHCHVLHNR